jgi:hypothetical protein
VRCGFLKSVSLKKIDFREHWHVGRPDRISKRLCIATLEIVDRHQGDPGAARAEHPRRIVQSVIEGLHVGWPGQIESAGADLNGISDGMILGWNIAGEESAACNC